MAVSGRLEAKTILFIALALLSCVANGELRHRIGLSSRRTLAATTAPAGTPEAADAPSADAVPASETPAATPEAADAPSADAVPASDAPAATPEAADAPSASAVPAATPEVADTPSASAVPAADAPAAATTPTAPPVTTSDSGATVFDVTKHGAKADGKADNAQAFIQTWRAACDSAAPAKVVIPSGTFMAGPVVFQGPCKGKQPVIVEVLGTVSASTDLSQYTSKEWILFEHIDGLVLKGGGVFDGKGESAWQYNDCKSNKDCTGLPASIKLSFVKNGVVTSITSLNSKYFHYHITDSERITLNNLTIIAPDESPNTDGIHISNTHVVSVTDSKIGTGDDCVSVGQGVTQLSVTRVTCGPGHGISIGSLGKYQNEEDVSGIIVSNCTLVNTTNGARIKTYGGSPPSQASNIVFQDLIMDNVKNPIIVDQKYGSRAASPSKVKISNVHFRNFKGTSTSDVAVSLSCSSSVPCEQVELANINLTYVGTRKAPNGLTSSCLNAKVTAVGTPNSLACAT